MPVCVVCVGWCAVHVSGGLRQDRENIVLDAFDVFCAHWRDKATRVRVVTDIAACWGIDSSRVCHLIQERKPNVEVSETAKTWSAGRMRVPTSRKHPIRLPSNFAATRHSLCLLERLAAGVVMREPMLLVGGTCTTSPSPCLRCCRVSVSVPVSVDDCS